MLTRAEERARSRHQELVKKHARQRDKLDSLADALVRTRTNMLATERAIVRSQKRIDKMVALATHTSGPTASPAPAVIEKMEAKVAPPLPDDSLDIPKVRAIPYSEAHPHSKIAKRKRTADDFKADVAKKKAAEGTAA